MSEAGRRGNLVWDYFDKVDDENKEAECKLCHNLYNYKTTSHNLKNHLKHKHSDVFMNLPASESMERKNCKRNEGTSVWAYFEAFDSERKIAICNECKKNISYKTTTANLKTHLKRVHKDLFAEMEGGECEEVYLEDCDENPMSSMVMPIVKDPKNRILEKKKKKNPRRERSFPRSIK